MTVELGPRLLERLQVKLRQMPINQVLEVERFIDFLNQRDDVAVPWENRPSDRALIQSATKVAKPGFASVWDNPEDAAYDSL